MNIKVNKLIDILKSKYMMKFSQKVFKGKNYNVKYVLKTNKKSKDLLVVFTSCTKVGQTARYNYVRTLDKYNCNKLFILDDFGFDSRGAYYLGENKDFAIKDDVKELINEVIKNINTEKNIFIGSSKGGYAALYFGLPIKNSIIITGAPQFKLGNYLDLPGHKNILQYIMGDTNEESIEYLNNIMEKEIENNRSNSNSIHIHYSKNEENYESDIKHLINCLNDAKIKKHEDIKEYQKHSELTNYFPRYIDNTLELYL